MVAVMESRVTLLPAGAPLVTTSATPKNSCNTAREFGMTMAAWICGRGCGSASGLSSVCFGVLKSAGCGNSTGIVAGGFQRGGALALSVGSLYGLSCGSGVVSCVSRLMTTGYGISTVCPLTRNENVYS